MTGEIFDGQGPALENVKNMGYDSAIGLYSMIESKDVPSKIDIEDIHEYVVFFPNQIKSINNDGTFTDGNNIYHNLQGASVENVQDVIDILSRLLTREVGFRPSRAKDSSHIYYSKTSIPRTQAEKRLKSLLSLLYSAFISLFNIIILKQFIMANIPAPISTISHKNFGLAIAPKNNINTTAIFNIIIFF